MWLTYLCIEPGKRQRNGLTRAKVGSVSVIYTLLQTKRKREKFMFLTNCGQATMMLWCTKKEETNIHSESVSAHNNVENLLTHQLCVLKSIDLKLPGELVCVDTNKYHLPFFFSLLGTDIHFKQSQQ